MIQLKKPTKKQRMIIYAKALEAILKNRREFACNAILCEYENYFKYRRGFAGYSTDDNKVLNYFHEFMKQKPKDNFGVVWWFGSAKYKKAKRIEALKKALGKCWTN